MDSVLGSSFHADRAVEGLLSHAPWTDLPEHSRNYVRRCIQVATVPGINNDSSDKTVETGDDEEGRYRAWLHGACCEATPPALRLQSGHTCDLAMAGGRVVIYRQRTLLVVGGRAAGTPSPNPGLPRGRAAARADQGPAPRVLRAADTGTNAEERHPTQLPDQSRRHEGGTELRPLRGAVVRLLQRPLMEPGQSQQQPQGGAAGAGGAVAAAAHFDADVMGGSELGGGPVRGAPLPALEGCAVATYGACVLIHGGFSPADAHGQLLAAPVPGASAAGALGAPGAVTCELRALVMEPDTMRPLPGEHRVACRTLVRQLMPDGSESGGAGAASAGGVGAAGAAAGRNWWEAVGGPTAAALAGAALAVARAGGEGQLAPPPVADVWQQQPGAGAGAMPPQGQVQQTAAAMAAAGNAAAAGLGASRPCAPPSARAGHHMAVDGRTCRLWMYGGWRHVSISPSIWSTGAYGSEAGDAAAAPERRAVDAEPCCYWAQLPTSGQQQGGTSGGPCGNSMTGCGAGACTVATAGAASAGSCGCGGSCSGRSSSGGFCGAEARARRDAAYVGGEAVVEHVTWHRLPLVAVAPGSSSRGSSFTAVAAGCSGGGRAAAASQSAAAAVAAPPFPDPLRALAVRVHDGALYVLSTTARPVPHLAPQSQRPLGAQATQQPGATTACSHRWLLHRIDLHTGACQLLQEPAPHQHEGSSSRASTGPASGSSRCGGPGGGPDAPIYDEDATVMADDVLPYIYVYGSRLPQLSHAAGQFDTSIFRLDLRAAAATASAAAVEAATAAPSTTTTGSRGVAAAAKGSSAGGGGGSSSGGSGSGSGSGSGGWWERVPVAGTQRLHAARGALGAASGGSVVLVGGVRDARRGVEARVQVALPLMAPPSGGASAALLRPGADDLAAARCRRALAERLRAAAPREVHFAHPDAHDGGKPCSVLAAALALYSRSSLFDDFFLGTLDDDEDEDGMGFSCGGRGGGELTLSPGGTKRPRASAAAPVGMSLPGHEPLVVAAAAAWAMGRSAVRPDWDVAFVGQLFDLARCWELAALQHECVRAVARRGPVLPLQQLPAALSLWEQARRAAADEEAVAVAVAAARSGLPARGGTRGSTGQGWAQALGAMRRLSEVWRRRLERAASGAASGTPELTAGNMFEVMEAARMAAAVAEAYEAAAAGGSSSSSSVAGCSSALFKDLQQGCIRVAGQLLLQQQQHQQPAGSGSGSGSGIVGADSAGISAGPKEGRIVAVFACRFGVMPLLFTAMRWWERRLAAALLRGSSSSDGSSTRAGAATSSCAPPTIAVNRGAASGAVVPEELQQVLELLEQLQDLDNEQQRAARRTAQRDLALSSLAGPTEPLPELTSTQGSRLPTPSPSSSAPSSPPSSKRARHQATLPAQLRAWLFDVLQRRTQPGAALSVLLAFGRCCRPQDNGGDLLGGGGSEQLSLGSVAAADAGGGGGCTCSDSGGGISSSGSSLPAEVEAALFDKMTRLTPAQLLALPVTFRTRGHADHTRLDQARRRCGGAGGNSAGGGIVQNVGSGSTVGVVPGAGAQGKVQGGCYGTVSAAREGLLGFGAAACIGSVMRNMSNRCGGAGLMPLCQQYADWLRAKELRARATGPQVGPAAGAGT